MTDERLAELQGDLEKAIEQRDTLKSTIEGDLAKCQQLAAEVNRLNQKRKDNAPLYQHATEAVADLSGLIQTENNRRVEEANKAEQEQLTDGG